MDLDIQDLIDTGTAWKLEGPWARLHGRHRGRPSYPRACRAPGLLGQLRAVAVRGRAGHEGSVEYAEARA